MPFKLFEFLEQFKIDKNLWTIHDLWFFDNIKPTWEKWINR